MIDINLNLNSVLPHQLLKQNKQTKTNQNIYEEIASSFFSWFQNKNNCSSINVKPPPHTHVLTCWCWKLLILYKPHFFERFSHIFPALTHYVRVIRTVSDLKLSFPILFFILRVGCWSFQLFLQILSPLSSPFLLPCFPMHTFLHHSSPLFAYYGYRIFMGTLGLPDPMLDARLTKMNNMECWLGFREFIINWGKQMTCKGRETPFRALRAI